MGALREVVQLDRLGLCRQIRNEIHWSCEDLLQQGAAIIGEGVKQIV